MARDARRISRQASRALEERKNVDPGRSAEQPARNAFATRQRSGRWKEHPMKLAILKLRRNEPLTKTDLGELERIFTEAGVSTSEELDRIRGEGGLGPTSSNS